MHPERRKNDYRTYNYIPPSSSTPAQKSRFRSTDPQRTEQQPPSATAIANLAEPLSIFDDLKPLVNRRVNVTPYPLSYIPPNPIRRSSVRDARLETANAIRERLLTDIQTNIREIDREITSLEHRQYVPPRFPPIQNPIHSPNNANHLWIRRQRKVYEVVPRLASGIQKTSRTSTAQVVEPHTESPAFIGQYHYGPEIEEVRIGTTDPENADRRSVLDELPDFGSPETFTLDQFRREQSALSHHRALLFVPECADYNDVGFKEFTKDLPKDNPKDTHVARSLTVSPLYEFPSPEKMTIQDFRSLIQTAPEPQTQVLPVPPVNDTQTDLTNTMLSKPVKHSRLSTRVPESVPSTQQTSTPVETDTPYFFSDYGHEGEEDRISLDFYPFILPTASEIIPDDNTSNIFRRQSQTSLPNPHALRQPQHIEPTNEHLKETENKNVEGAVAATKHTVSSSTSTSLSKKVLPISVENSMPTPLARNNKSNTKDHRKTPLTSTPTTIIEQSRANNLNNFSVRFQTSSPAVSARKSTTDQRSPGHSGKSQSNKKTASASDSKQQTSVSPLSDSSLPVPLYSPDLDDVRPSTSRAATPERRNSIPPLDESILLASTNIMNFDDSLTELLQTESSEQLNAERSGPSPSTNFASLQDIQSDESKLYSSLPSDQKENEPISQSLIQETNRSKSISPLTINTTTFEHDDLCLPPLSLRQSDTSDANLTSIGQEDTFRQALSPDHDHNQLERQFFNQENHSSLEEDFSSMSTWQQRSNLPLILHPIKPEQRTFINEQTHVDGDRAIARHQMKPTDRPRKNWRERIDTILANQQLATKKYSHIKSRVDSFANFDYQPRRILIIPKKQSTRMKDKQLTKRIARFHPQLSSGPTPQIFGRLWCLPDGSTRVFHELLHWKGEPKIKSRSLDHFRSKTRRNDFKIFNEKPRWHSESKISELRKGSPRRRLLAQTVSLLSIADIDVASLHQQESQTELRIYDTHFDSQQTVSRFEESSSEITPKNSKLVWRKKSKLKELTWANIKYQPKRSQVQIFHEPVRWKKQSKLRLTYSATWDSQAKVKYSSTIDLPATTKRKGLFAQSYDPQWKDIQSSWTQRCESIDQATEELRCAEAYDPSMRHTFFSYC